MSLYNDLQKFVEQSFWGPESTIYHYTNFGQEIINSGYLRLSPHDELNRKNNRELKVGCSIIRECFQKSSLYRMIPEFDKYVESGIKVYVGSFSEEENSRHAIENYGKDCIGLKIDFARQFCMDNGALLTAVKYSRKESEKIISEIFKMYESGSGEICEKQKTLFLWLSIVLPLILNLPGMPFVPLKINARLALFKICFFSFL